MAFIQSVPVIHSSNAPVQKCTTTTKMTATPSPTPNDKTTSRRAVLRLFATGVATTLMAGVANAAAKDKDDFDLKELQKDVEELKYEDEVVDVGPDDREKNPTRIKKKKPDPEYVAEEKELVESEDKAYSAMVEKEKADEAAIKAKFSKKK